MVVIVLGHHLMVVVMMSRDIKELKLDKLRCSCECKKQDNTIIKNINNISCQNEKDCKK